MQRSGQSRISHYYKCCLVTSRAATNDYFDNRLKVASAILGRNTNYHNHLIFPHDPVAARPISRQSKKKRLCRQPLLRDRTQKTKNRMHKIWCIYSVSPKYTLKLRTFKYRLKNKHKKKKLNPKIIYRNVSSYSTCSPCSLGMCSLTIKTIKIDTWYTFYSRLLLIRPILSYKYK